MFLLPLNFSQAASTLDVHAHRTGIVLSALLCSLWLLYDSRNTNVANAVRQKIAKHELLLQQSRGLLASWGTDNTGFADHFLRDYEILHFFFMLIYRSAKFPLAGRMLGRIPDDFLDLHLLRSAALFYTMEIQRLWCIIRFHPECIGWSIVTDLVDMYVKSWTSLETAVALLSKSIKSSEEAQCCSLQMQSFIFELKSEKFGKY